MKKNINRGLLSLLIASAAWALATAACGDDDAPAATPDASADHQGSDTAPPRPTPDADVLPDDMEIKTYSSDPTKLHVNSYVIHGTTSAALVDGQFYKADAAKVVELIQSTGKTLKYVILTHAHPDHYLGFKVIKDAFPSAEFVTSAPIADAYKAMAQTVFDEIKTVEGDAIADGIVDIKGLEVEVNPADGIPPRSIVYVDGALIALYLNQFPSDNDGPNIVVGVPHKRVITGDFFFNKSHLYLGECKIEGEGWKGNLGMLAPFQFNEFYPGHGQGPGEFGDVVGQIEYMDVATAIMREEANFPISADAAPPPEGDGGLENEPAVRAMNRIKGAFPDYTGDAVLELSVKHYMENCE
jgi:hypothetical protein